MCAIAYHIEMSSAGLPVSRRLRSNTELTLCMYMYIGKRSVNVDSRKLYAEYACAEERLDISCDPGHVLVLESAKYGRADQSLAELCRVPFAPSCAVDVRFLLNRACAGRAKCSLPVGVDAFGDPCGYKEFLSIEYRCVSGESFAWEITC